MPDTPTDDLLQLLEHLNLASREDVLSVGRRARQLARGLPLFDSVWVDALAQKRVVTPYQARQINGGRGNELFFQGYVIRQPLVAPAYARAFAAREVASGRDVRLITADVRSTDPAVAGKQLKTLVDVSRRLTSESLAVVDDAGVDDPSGTPQLWSVCRMPRGIAVQEWLIPNGRMPSEAVYHVARQMAAALTELERFELLHADITPANVSLDNRGQVELLMPGLRAVLRPEEGYGYTELSPGGYDYLAPERVLNGSPPDVASELYACGSFWWHLLTGRSPIPGGDSLTKLRNIQKPRVPDVRQLAPDTPEPLAKAIFRCMELEPEKRGSSFADLSRELGAPDEDKAFHVGECVHRHLHPKVRIGSMRSWDPSRPRRRGAALAAAAAIAAALLCLWQFQKPGAAPVAEIPAPRPAAPTNDEPQPPIEAAIEAAVEAPGANDFTPVDDVVMLTAGEAAEGRLPKLHAGITVRSPNESRAAFRIPPGGLVIDQPHVRLENIDFVSSQAGRESSEAMIHLQSRWIEFYQCSFQSADLPFGSQQPVALSVAPNVNQGRADTSVTEAHVVMDACVLRGVAAGVDVQGTSSVIVEAAGTLYLGPGPLVRLRDASRPTLQLMLSQCTLRGARALIAYHYGSSMDRFGPLAITAKNCVFAPQADGALLYCEGADDPRVLMENARWNAYGSLISADLPIALWQPTAEAPAQRIDDASFAVDGLSRGQFEFVSPQVNVPAASRLKRWTAPLRGDTPPGIGPEPLYLPDLAPR